MNTETMRDSGVEWLGIIPKGWQLDRLKDLVSLRDEKSTEKSNIENYIELEDLDQGTGRLLSVRSTANVESAVMKFYKNDVLFGKLRPYLRKYYLATFDGKCTGEILAFKPEKIRSDFLLYFIASDGFIEICNAMSYGAKMPRVNYPKQLALLPVCLPSKNEQQAIAQYLDQRCGKLDAIITIKQQQIKTLDALRQSIIYQAVTKGLDAAEPLVDSGVEWLGMVPREWKVTRAKLVASIFIPQRNKPELNDDFGIPWVTMENMDQPVISKTVNFVTVEAQQEAGSRILPKLSVIASCVGTFGVASINEIDVIINQQLQAYIPLRIDAHYLRYLITISNQYFDQVSSQTTIVYVNGEKFGNLPVLLPSRREQSEIVGFLSMETQRLDQLKTNLNRKRP